MRELLLRARCSDQHLVTDSFHPHTHSPQGLLLLLHFKTKKQMLCEIKEFVETSKQQSWDLDADLLAPKPVLITTKAYCFFLSPSLTPKTGTT